MSLIKDAIDTIAALANARQKRIEIVDLPDGKRAVDQSTGEVRGLYETPRVRTAKLGDLASLRDWCATEGEHDQGGDIIIGRTGQTTAQTPSKALAHERSTAAVPFYDAFVPKGPMKLRAFIAWIDLLRPGLDPKDADAVDACLRAVTMAEGSSVTVAQSGAAISVKAEASRGLSTERPFPKRISARVPFGDPAFVTVVTFSLTLEASGSDLVAHAVVDELALGPDGLPCGPRDAFVAWARETLAGVPGWTVMVGA